MCQRPVKYKVAVVHSGPRASALCTIHAGDDTEIPVLLTNGESARAKSLTAISQTPVEGTVKCTLKGSADMDDLNDWIDKYLLSAPMSHPYQPKNCLKPISLGQRDLLTVRAPFMVRRPDFV